MRPPLPFNPSTILRRVLACAAMAVFLVLPGAAQQEEESSPIDDVFLEIVDVDVVNIEVFVTDEQGNRVTGLEREDFEIFEDGRPMEITNFYAVAERRAERERRLRTPVVPGPGQDAPPLPTIEESGVDSLRLVIYIDNENINPLNRNRFFAHLRRFVEGNVIEGDQVAVYTFERALHLRQPFTSSVSQVLGTLDEIERMSGGGISNSDERRDLLREIDRARSRLDVEGKVQMYARSARTELDFTIDALGEMVSSLAGLPGRKMVMYISDGLPMRPAEDLFAAMAERFDDPSMIIEAITYDASRQFQELTARANANQVTFYTISAAGLRAHGDAGADVSLSQGYTHIHSIRRLNFEAPLRSLAIETGGLAVVGTSNFDGGLDRISADVGGFYSLGYTPAHGGDGRYYEVEVKLKKKGLEARHREGYRAKTTSQRMSERTLSILHERGLATNPLAIEIELGSAGRSEGNLFSQPLRVRVPIENVTLLPRDELHVGRLIIFLAVVDEEGRTASVADQPWPIEIGTDELEQARAMTIAHEVTLTMRPGFHRIAVGVRDELGADESFVTLDFVIGGR